MNQCDFFLPRPSRPLLLLAALDRSTTESQRKRNSTNRVRMRGAGLDCLSHNAPCKQSLVSPRPLRVRCLPGLPAREAAPGLPCAAISGPPVISCRPVMTPDPPSNVLDLRTPCRNRLRFCHPRVGRPTGPDRWTRDEGRASERRLSGAWLAVGRQRVIPTHRRVTGGLASLARTPDRIVPCCRSQRRSLQRDHP